MSSPAAIRGNLPSGSGICTTIPDVLYLPELVSRSSLTTARTSFITNHSSNLLRLTCKETSQQW